MQNKYGLKVGDPVWFRGYFAKRFSIRGVIESIRPDFIFVRLENGNPGVAGWDQLVPRKDARIKGNTT